MTQPALLNRLERHIARLDRRIAYLKRIADQVSWLRLAIFLVGVFLSVAALFTFRTAIAFWMTALVTLIAFVAAVRYSGRLTDGITGLTIWRNIKKAHIARMTLDWSHIPRTPLMADHPLAIDLDLLGDYSMHRLMDVSVTREGCDRLRDWLLKPQLNLETIQPRTQLVRELIALPLFRDKLAFHARIALPLGDARWRADRMRDWFTRKKTIKFQPTLTIATLLAGINVVLGVLFVLHVLPPLVLISLLVYWGVIRSSDQDDDSLDLLALLETLGSVFGFLEKTHPRHADHLVKLCAPFRDPITRPSVQMRRVTRLVFALSVKETPLLYLLINSIVPWNLYFASRLERARVEIAALLPGWLDTWAELEALSSLACLGWLNPDYTFPAIGSSMLDMKSLGHPLIAAGKRVRNDFNMDQLGRLILITGSNMAGKSTFLRTLGVNLCLAYAGAPICAESAAIGLFRVFTCIRVSDSLADGFSYFYAEVHRLKALLTALEEPNARPLFFLIDEIFRGTNNQERLIGSRAYIRALIGRNGGGVLSTHDLELIKLAEDTPLITNQHFREDVIDGKLVFDYKLRPGPSPTTNALKIMAAAGLPVEEPEV